MDRNDQKREDGGVKRNVGGGACDVEALQKCLAEHKGDYVKCQAQIEAFKAACTRTPSSSLSPRPRPNSKTTPLVTEL